VRGFVAAIAAAAGVAWWAGPSGGIAPHAPTLMLLAALALVTGARPIKLPCLPTALTATHPIILATLVAFGARFAVLMGLAGVVAAVLAESGQRKPIRVAFNSGSVVLATTASAWAFVLTGGLFGAELASMFAPLLAATAAFFVVNTGLVASVIALEKRVSLFDTWSAAFSWSAASYFSAFTLAAGLIFAMRALGPWGLALGIPPCWMILSFYSAHRDRLREHQQRVAEVEQLNVELAGKVDELKAALAHVRQLQGLLPICMHCKSIRDDDDTWHRIEAYLAKRADVQFTHAICGSCREEHYPPIDRQAVESSKS